MKQSEKIDISKVTYKNGISRGEALLLAKKQLNDSGYLQDYDIKQPKILVDFLERDFPQYWFVGFPLERNILESWTYLVVIKKDDGKIIYSNPYHASQIIDYSWMPDQSNPMK